MNVRYMLGGVEISGAFTDKDGTRYPANWLQFATDDDRRRVGIVREEVTPPPEHLSIEYAGAKCYDADDIDAHTARRIRKLHSASDRYDIEVDAELHEIKRELRALRIIVDTKSNTEQLQSAKEALAEIADTDAQAQTIRDEGAAAKAELATLVANP